jgi:hypothetical protein
MMSLRDDYSFDLPRRMRGRKRAVRFVPLPPSHYIPVESPPVRRGDVTIFCPESLSTVRMRSVDVATGIREAIVAAKVIG